MIEENEKYYFGYLLQDDDNLENFGKVGLFILY